MYPDDGKGWPIWPGVPADYHLDGWHRLNDASGKEWDEWWSAFTATVDPDPISKGVWYLFPPDEGGDMPEGPHHYTHFDYLGPSDGTKAI